MNLKSKGARRTLAATCSTAVVLAGASLASAAPASAAGVTLAYGPTPTAATVLNIDPTASDTAAGASYGLKVTGTTNTAMRVNVLSAPTSGALYYERISGNGTPLGNGAGAGIAQTVTGSAGSTSLTASAVSGANLNGRAIKISKAGEPTEIAIITTADTTATTTWTIDRPLASAHSGAAVNNVAASGTSIFYTAGPGTSAPVTSFAANDNIYFGAVVPGTYTFQVYNDSNANGVYDSAQDDATPVFTMTAKDITANTTTTSDDWSPSISVPSSLGLGQAVTASVSTSDLTTVDTRGANGTTGKNKLGEAIAANTTIAFAQTAGISNVAAAPTFDGSSLTRTSSTVTSATNPVVTTIAGIASSSVTRSTSIVDNGVTTVTSGSTDVVGSVKRTNAAVAVKTGTASVTYTATVDAGADDSGKVVYFTLTPTVNTSAVLTADGSLVSSASGVKVYSALTDSTGVASLKVTTDTTTVTSAYTVGIKSNNVADGSNPTLTATYADAAAASFELTTSTADMSPVVDKSVTVAGKLLDQFAAKFQPASSATQQVTVTVDQNNTTYGGADVTGYATISDGAFSYVYTPATTPAAGRQDVVRFAYAGATSLDSSVYWTTAEAASSVTITAPVSGATPTQKKATATHGAGTTVTGSVLNASSAGLAYKTVTLTGTPGVYFSTVATPTTATSDDLKASLTVSANASGNYTAYAFFVKAGAATITATSGSAKATVDVSVTEADDPYQVIAIDAAVEPGGTSVVTGEVKNAWGFPVAGTIVDLSLGASKVATLGTNQVTTNSEGVWSTTLTGASGAEGTATLTATLCDAGSPCVLKAASPKAVAAWLDNAGLTIAHGEFQDTASITVDPSINKTTVSAPATKAGAGSVKLTGKAKPGSTVEIYAKPAGSSIPFALVGVASADSDGDWSSTEWVSSSTTFFAKTSVSTSSTVTVTLTKPSTASVKISATALGKGRVRVSVNGSPNMKGVITVYVNGRKATSFNSNAWGDALTTVRTTKGVKTFKVVFAPSGYTAGSASVTVRVR